MLDVDQNYGTPETPKPFPTFKECVAQDVQNVIFNSNEFAEERYIHRKINSNKLARDRRRARQCRCIYKKQHKALSLSVSQNTRPAEIMPWA